MTVAEKSAVIDIFRCVGCGACTQHCPVHAIRMTPGWKAIVNTDQCIGCRTCVNICHKHAPHFTARTQNGSALRLA